MNRSSYLGVLLLTALLALACSSGSTSPVVPTQNDPGLTAETQASPVSSKAIWGLWEVTIDTTTWQATAIPLRGAQYTVDVVNFLQKPAGNPANLSIQVTDTSEWFTQGLIGVDVGLKHPFPGLNQYTGFDVLGVFIGPGTVNGKHDEEVWYSNGADEPILLNADGYTRWMNPTEFLADGSIFHFMPGAAGNPDPALFTSTINGYKYFADGLDKDQDVAGYLTGPASIVNRGFFRPGSFNTREYRLKFPIVGGSPDLVFQYAVVAHWVDPDTTLSGDPDTLDVPGDFPIAANASEAVCLSITDNSTLFYKDGFGGGKVDLKLEIFDWGALESGSVPSEIHAIGFEVANSPLFPDAIWVYPDPALFTAGSSAISSIYEVETSIWAPKSKDDVQILITVESESPPEFDPGTGAVNDDRLASYFFHKIPVSSDVPSTIHLTSPNGGEVWTSTEHHNITWTTTEYAENIKLEYSKDGFVSDVHEIVGSTENDGVFDWLIPNDPSTTVRVRATLVSMPSICDISDGDFTIKYVPDLTLNTHRSTMYPGTGFSYYDYIRLDWPDIAGAVQYAVYRSYLFATPYSWVEIATVNPPATLYDNLYTGTYAINWDSDYIYEVRARSVAGDPSSEFLSTQQALVVMETNEVNLVDTYVWNWRPSPSAYNIAWGGAWNCDDPTYMNVALMGWNLANVIDAWTVIYCAAPIPDLAGESDAYVEFVWSNGPGYVISEHTGWAPGTMSAIPTGSEPTYYDFDPAPDSEYRLGVAYNASFTKDTFGYYFGEDNGAFSMNYYPFQITRYGIPRLLQDGVDYAGFGVASHNATPSGGSGYLLLDSMAIVEY